MSIPPFEDTVDLLEWIGFTQETAADIHKRFRRIHWQWQDVYWLLDFAYGQVEGITYRFGNMPNEWKMTRMGIRQDIQEAILHPNHKKAFQTQTLEFWLKDTLRINWLALERLNDRTSSSAARLGTGIATFNDGSESALPRPECPRDHTRLWKPKTALKMQIPNNGWVEDGNIEGSKFQSKEGDFAHGFYWTEQREYAEMFRAYAETRCVWAETWLISVDVPNTFLAGLNGKNLCFTGAQARLWKEYVWLSKKKGMQISLPRHLRKYTEADLIIGHVCARDPQTVRNIEKEDLQTTIDESWVMELSNGEKATQFVIVNGRTMHNMLSRVKIDIHIDVTAPRRSREMVEQP